MPNPESQPDASATNLWLVRLNSKFESQHELQLPCKPCANIVREKIVVINVVAVNRCDLSEGSGPGCRAGGRRALAIEVECKIVGIRELRMVENVERLYAEFHTESLVDSGFFG